MSSSQQENTPLLQKNGEGNTYYFKKIERKGSSFQATSDQDGGQMIETLPQGATEQAFAPRTLGASSKVSCFWKHGGALLCYAIDMRLQSPIYSISQSLI